MRKLRIAIAGFRHGHIFALHNHAKQRDDVETVAASEEDEATRASLSDGKKITITHSSHTAMLDSVPCDIVAVGDYYGRRGALVIDALTHGKHVISDKPICTSLDELDQIEKIARERGLVVGCMLDMRDSALVLELRRQIRQGAIGEVHAISVGGQHPLLFGTRASWYFEPGKHGGTINDIAVHALDAIPWITGQKFTEINCARAWNARLKEVPHFQDAAQFMLTMNNGCGVLGDVSYFGPDASGYGIPQYWRMTFWGTEGVIEGSYNAKELTLYKRTEKSPQIIPATTTQPGAYLASFLGEVRGEKQNLHLSSAEVLAASRLALRVQQAADGKMGKAKLVSVVEKISEVGPPESLQRSLQRLS
jgi:predicted dehydrogenase